ncbi:MAG: CinA family nicotinamide mononucleotide deamidase-related protein, partial [candidate division WOR-3 bacterium]|nr:CinA family nicotinamide mononucleotide deamidase-related protein [candidate division WOR-3 bacterium]MDW7988427.1 CinA family nicotinamide mononucleotide deamidase-related protein [candidate division WOR-3 bacterium]
LNEIGIEVCEIITIRDERSLIEKTIKRALDETNLVFVTGGLGPTPDDQTMTAVANVLKRRLVLDETLYNKIEKSFLRQGHSVPELATKQALIIQGSIVLDNPIGQAPGLILKLGKKLLILLPGVPIELQKIFEAGVVPYLHEHFKFEPTLSLTIRTTNLSEMTIVERIEESVKRYSQIKVAYLPSVTGVDVKITNIPDRKVYLAIEKELQALLAPFIYGYGEETIEEVIGKLCRKNGLTISVAESCTGGLICDKITNVAGSSEYFIGGAVVYSNKLKQLICDVKTDTLKKYGAVSKETVMEMAEGIRRRFGTDLGIGVSGIAGPSGATKEKPVGLVFIGVATKRGTNFEKYIFSGNRRVIKEKAAVAALDFLRRIIQNFK